MTQTISFGKINKYTDEITLAVRDNKLLVPKLNPAYHFPEFTKDMVADIKEGRHILLTGHCGCGKSSNPEQIAARINQSVTAVNLNGQITVGDFVGLWTVKGGETVWVDGVLTNAMRNGYWLILNEVDYGEPAILGALNTVLERGGGSLMLKEKGNEVVQPHPDFRIFATANTAGSMAKFRHLYQGTNIMNEAFMDRWQVYHVDYLPKEEEIKVIINSVAFFNQTDEVKKAAMTKAATNVVTVANMIRAAFVEGQIDCTFSLRRLLDWAEKIARYRDPIKAAESTIFSKVTDESKQVIKGIIERVLISKTEQPK